MFVQSPAKFMEFLPREEICVGSLVVYKRWKDDRLVQGNVVMVHNGKYLVEEWNGHATSHDLDELFNLTPAPCNKLHKEANDEGS